MTYHLIGHPQTRAMRVMWMLEEAGVSYDLTPSAPGSSEARAIHPSGKIPMLVVEGRTLTDSVAIAQFIADRHAVATAPAGTVERAQQDAHTQFVVEEIDGPLWLNSKHRFILPEDQRVEAIFPTLKAEFARGIARLEARLGDGPFLMGEMFTVADIMAAHCLSWARAAHFDVASERVTAYGKNCRARPAFRRALERAATLR